jgi:hypothetical protein
MEISYLCALYEIAGVYPADTLLRRKVFLCGEIVHSSYLSLSLLHTRESRPQYYNDIDY